MLSIQTPTSKPQPYTPNLLPARLSHNGPIPTDTRYWNPTTETSDTSTSATQTAYFRGRKLQGKPVKLPEGYQGAVLKFTDRELPSAEKSRGGEEEDGEEDQEVKVVEKVGEFEEVVVWAHERLVVESEDPYLKGLGEWVGFAEAMHGEEDEARAS